eukprot:175754_1
MHPIHLFLIVLFYEINNNLIQVLKTANNTGIEFHADIEDCDNEIEDEESVYGYWKSRYFFEIGVLIREKEFRDKFICCCQCELKYSCKDIEIFMDNFSKYFDNICDKILIDTINNCYNQMINNNNNYNNNNDLQLEWMNVLELFVINICCQLNMNISKRIHIISKIKNIKVIDN